MTTAIDTPVDIKFVDHVAASTVVSEVTNPPVVVESQEQPRHKKLVNVTVTILSIAGLYVEDVGAGAGTKKRGGILSRKFSIRNSSNGSSGFGSLDRKIKTDESESETDCSTLTASMSRDNSAEPTTTTTQVVASMSRVTKNKNVMIHLSSLPLAVPEITDGGLANKKKKERTSLCSVVRWPEHAQQHPQEATHGNKQRDPASYQFQLGFHTEYSTTTSRFVPQHVPIQISISRFGRMYKLGTANLLVSGEENGDSSIAVPVTSCYLGIPKSNKFKGILGGSLTKHNEDKAMRLLTLKGDTLKCGLDPTASLRVLVHVSEPLSETLEISPKLNVTTIPSNVQAMMSPKEQTTPKEEPVIQQEDGPAADNGVPSAISWEYHPNLATIVVNRPEYDINDADPANGGENGTLLQEETHSVGCDDGTEDIVDEPSCSSSAYMSAIEESHGGGHQCYPSKYDLSTRSSSTATMTTTSVSVLSDLTDGHSWQSQTGIEVIPYSPVNPMYEQVGLHSNSRSLDVKSVNEYDSITEGTHTTGVTSFGRASITSSQFFPSPTAAPAKKTWQQRFACGLPVCGAVLYNEPANSVSPDWLRMTGKCESLVDHDYDEESSSSESSSDS